MKITPFIILLVIQLFNQALAENPPLAEYVGSQVCGECHKKVAAEWQGSHHQQAMQHADVATVLADFNNTTFTHFGTTTRFYKKGGKYFVNTVGADG